MSSNTNRVLVWGLSNNLAGTEGVIRNIVSVCSNEVAFDFLVTEDIPNHYDLLDSCNRMFRLPRPTNISYEFKNALLRHFEKYSVEYSTVWSNQCDGRNIEVLKLGAKFGVSRRIMHSHSSNLDAPFIGRVLSNIRKRTIFPKLTDCWACSNEAGRYMFGDHPFTVIPNPIAFEKYRFSINERNAVRDALNISLDAFVIGYVARLTKTKNHEFILRLLSDSKQLQNAQFVIVGDGPERDNLQSLSSQLDIDSRVHFVQSTKEIADLYSCFDVFVFPSLYEGLPLVLLEAQANALPVVMSSNISTEGVISNSVKRVSLNEESAWIDAILQSRRDKFCLNEKADYYNLEKQASFFKQQFKSRTD